MGLLSQLAAKPEVLRVSTLQGAQHRDFVVNAVVQSATTTDVPLLDAGLDGSGEVIQARSLQLLNQKSTLLTCWLRSYPRGPTYVHIAYCKG